MGDEEVEEGGRWGRGEEEEGGGGGGGRKCGRGEGITKN